MVLQREYDMLSEEARLYFHPPMFERDSFRWVPEQLMLLLSCFDSVKRLLLLFFPKAVVISIVATNQKKEIVAFTYMKVLKKLSNSTYCALDGIVVTERYQGKGLGYKILSIRDKIARTYKITMIWTYILSSNAKMLSLANKLGYKIIGKMKHVYKGVPYEAYSLILET